MVRDVIEATVSGTYLSGLPRAQFTDSLSENSCIYKTGPIGGYCGGLFASLGASRMMMTTTKATMTIHRCANDVSDFCFRPPLFSYGFLNVKPLF